MDLRRWTEKARNSGERISSAQTFFFFTELVFYMRYLQREERILENMEYSYRGFDVVAMAISFLEDSAAHVCVGMNFKPARMWPETQCAELHALQRAMRHGRHNGQGTVDLMLVSGPPQDDPSGVKTRTLHLCPNCREMALLFLERGSLLREDTVFVTVHPTMNIFEAQILKAMLRLHGTIK